MLALTPSTVNALALSRWPFTLNWPNRSALDGTGTTPGASAMSDWNVRPFSGRPSTNRRSTVVATAGDSLITGVASTVTTSTTPPIRSSMCTARASFTLITKPSRVVGENPGAVALMVYSPGGSCGTLNVPVPLVANRRSRPVAGAETTTSAPTTAPPLSSTTVPLMSPVADCASAGSGTRVQSNARDHKQAGLGHRAHSP